MRISGAWAGCWIVAVGLAGAGVASAELRPDPYGNLAAVKEALRLLSPISEKELQGLVVQLSSDEFVERQNARRRLMRVPESLAPALEKLREQSGDPEVRKSLAQVLARMEPQDRTVVSKLARSALVHGHRDLGSEFLAALPTAPDRRSAEKVIAAARLSASDDEQAEVIEALSSEIPSVREGAVRVLTALDADPREALKDVLNDEDGMVRLAVAEIFAAKADPACLGALDAMLSGDDFYLRWRAAGMLRSMTGGEVDVDPLETLAESALDHDKWRTSEALQPWQMGEAPPLIALFEENEDLSSWTIARGDFVDVPLLEPRAGHLSFLGTGHCVWASPLRFQNYRVRLQWRFEWEDSVSNAGFSLAKFKGPPPQDFAGWTKDGALEVEIKEGSAGALFPSGTKMQVAGKAVGGERKIRHWHNERSTDWNTLEIEERDGSLRVWVNGLLQNEATGLSDAMTTFGLRSDRTPIDWRGLMLEPLPGARVAPPLKEMAEEIEQKEDDNEAE